MSIAFLLLLKRQMEITRRIVPICQVVLRQEDREETGRNMHEAVEMHIQGMLENKLPIPESVAIAEYIAVAA